MMPKSIAPTERRPIGMPAAYMQTSAKSNANGIVRATRPAISGRPRKKKSTATTRPIPRSTLWATVWSVASMRWLRS
jgi:hypothetical protein